MELNDILALLENAVKSGDVAQVQDILEEYRALDAETTLKLVFKFLTQLMGK